MSLTFVEGKYVYQLQDTTGIHWSQDMEGEYHYVRGSEHPVVKLVPFLIVKVTAKGAWIVKNAKPEHTIWGSKQWISRDSRKFAATPDAAKALAISRRMYHLRMEEKRLVWLRARLAALERFEVPKVEKPDAPELQETQATE